MPLIRVTDEGTHIKDRRPSRHKPITLLWAIGRLAAEQGRTGDHLVEWQTFREEVGPLLRDFGLPNSRVTPQYPFWHLRSSGLWDVEGIDTHEGTPTPSQLAAAGARAGLGKDAAKVLRRSPARAEAIGLICSRHLPDVDRVDSHYSAAAHIRGLGAPHLGPDQLSNLLCLCPNHHIEFDRFAIYIEEDWTVRRNSTGAVEYELKLHADHVIDQDHIRYHRALCGHR
ncbi:HNH endonuclease [Streptomyces cyaneofuscatus]|uniref:HNH endonuclease n=1 Tax=Streptomyces cyaneofuscatus TaxID=66883 RepID=UPI00382C9C12